jgi:hypothetical protein
MSFLDPIRYLLLVLFTLLQCVAPLAHAHVNGDNAAHNAHIALAGDYDFAGHQHHDIGIVSHSAHDHDSSVVCMPPESRATKLIIDLPVLASQCGLLPQEEPTSHIFDALYQASVASTPYRHPFSQAPPL